MHSPNVKTVSYEHFTEQWVSLQIFTIVTEPNCIHQSHYWCSKKTTFIYFVNGITFFKTENVLVSVTNYNCFIQF